MARGLQETPVSPGGSLGEGRLCTCPMVACMQAIGAKPPWTKWGWIPPNQRRSEPSRNIWTRWVSLLFHFRDYHVSMKAERSRADPGFSWGGGVGSRGPLGVLMLSNLWYHLSLSFKHFDTKWDKKYIVEQLLRVGFECKECALIKLIGLLLTTMASQNTIHSALV